MGLKQVLARFPSMFRPGKAYESFKMIEKEGFKEAIQYLTVLLAIEAAILSSVGYYMVEPFLRGIAPRERYATALPIALVGVIPFTVIMGITTMAAASALLHMAVKILGGKAGYRQTFKAVAYGSTPSLTTMVIPQLMVLTIPWSLLIITVGIGQLHEMTRRRAALSILLLLALGIAVSLTLRML